MLAGRLLVLKKEDNFCPFSGCARKPCSGGYCYTLSAGENASDVGFNDGLGFETGFLVVALAVLELTM